MTRRRGVRSRGKKMVPRHRGPSTHVRTRIGAYRRLSETRNFSTPFRKRRCASSNSGNSNQFTVRIIITFFCGLACSTVTCMCGTVQYSSVFITHDVGN